MDVFRYRSLDAWRGLAALSVVVFHAFGSHTNATYSDFHPFVGMCWEVGHHGWLGVHIFFAVSGYCISASAVSGLTKGRSALSFLRDRMLRIYPVYWAALVFLIVVGALTAPFIGRSPISAFPASVADFMPDLLLVQPFFGNKFFLLVSWSLAYEVAFYLMCALGMLLLVAGIPVVFVLGAGLMLAVYGATASAPPFPLNLWPEFYMGSLAFVSLAAKSRIDKRSFVLATVALVFLVLLGAVTRSSYGLMHFATAAITALGIILLFPLDKRMADWRWLSPLFFIGGISYSLYLVHLVVASKLMNLSKRFIALDSLTEILVIVIATLAAIACAALFYRYIESPFEKWRKSLRVPHRQIKAMAEATKTRK